MPRLSEIAKRHVERKRATDATRTRRSGIVKTGNENISVRRCFLKDARLHQPYIVQAKLWNERKMCSVQKDLATLPIQETLDALVEEGQEEKWSSLDQANQQAFKTDLAGWKQRVQFPLCVRLFLSRPSASGGTAPHTRSSTACI